MTLRGTRWVLILVGVLAACNSGTPDPTDEGAELPGTEVIVRPDLGPEDIGPADEGSLDIAPDVAVDTLTDVAVEIEDPCSYGAQGCPCASPEDCLSGLCIDTMDGLRCTAACATNDPCPKGWYCGVVTGTGSDITYGCIDPFARLCQPCMKDQECVPVLASTGYRYLCVDYGRTGSFCGVSCTAEADCPDGFGCTEVLSNSGTFKQCRPLEGAACPCTEKYIQQGNVTECREDNEFGTCRAERTCDQLCGAKTPEAEICNAIDDDCDDQTDEDFVEDACTLPSGSWVCPGKNVCKDGTIVCTGREPTDEACNGIDDNCDGATDEEGALNCLAYFKDVDKDAFGVAGDTKCQCLPTPPYSATVDGDCNDADPQVFNGAVEACNGKDDNCNGSTDEDGAQGCIPYYVDQDGDLFGVTAEMKCLCAGAGLHTARIGGDCNDALPAINPGATEVCNGKDDDCDGTVDNPSAQGCSVYYMDSDGDKFGRSDTFQCLCTPSPPYTATQGGDCGDDDKLVRPTGVEICNGKDDDCDGVTDPPNTMGGTPYYKDQDGDGVGSGTDYQVRCTPGDLYTSPRNDDCNDDDAAVYPGATEICNGKLDNCTGALDGDNSVGCNRYYYDKDGDSFGVTSMVQCRCGGTPSGFYRAIKDGDCNDNVAAIRPGAQEECYNSIDDNCNGQTDEEGGRYCINYFIDLDGDGFSNDPYSYKCLCTPTTPYTATDTTGDCCDHDRNVFPNQSGYFTSRNACGTYDYDCNTYDDFQYRSLVACKGEFLSCGITREGWTSTVPGCGGSGDWSTDCEGFIGIGCAGSGGGNRTQGCK